MRHLWLSLLESLEDTSKMMYPSSRSNLWNNLIQVGYYTEEIISSAFDSGLSHLAKLEIGLESLSPLRSLLTKVTPEANIPYSTTKLVYLL